MMACAGSPPPFAASRGRVVFGLAIMLIGMLLLADRLDWWGVRVNVPFWALLLLLLGFSRLHTDNQGRDPADHGRRFSHLALWFIGLGTWGLFTEYHLFGFGHGRAWPLLVLLVGVFIVWRAVDPPAHRRAAVERGGERS